jgi:hypothetical protein
MALLSTTQGIFYVIVIGTGAYLLCSFLVELKNFGLKGYILEASTGKETRDFQQATLDKEYKGVRVGTGSISKVTVLRIDRTVNKTGI